MHINVKEDKSDFAAYVRNVVRQADCPQGSEVSLSTQGIWTCSAGSMPPIAQVLHSNLARRPIISSWERTWLIPIHFAQLQTRMAKARCSPRRVRLVFPPLSISLWCLVQLWATARSVIWWLPFNLQQPLLLGNEFQSSALSAIAKEVE